MITNEGVELLAIHKAIDIAKHNIQNQQHEITNITILSDCQTAITSIQKTITTKSTYWKIKQKIHENIRILTKAGIEVTIDWIPGHCGIEENELADTLAKQGAADTELEITTELETPLSVVKYFIRNKFNHMQQKWWNENTTSVPLHIHHKNITTKTPPELFTHITRRQQNVLERVRIGNATDNHHLHKMKYATSNQCDNCTEIDSPQHRIMQCPQYDQQRTTLQHEIEQTGSPFTMSTMFGLLEVEVSQRKHITKATLTFLAQTKLDRLFLWDQLEQTTHTKRAAKPRRREMPADPVT
jgi:ribonuclease HI